MNARTSRISIAVAAVAVACGAAFGTAGAASAAPAELAGREGPLTVTSRDGEGYAPAGHVSRTERFDSRDDRRDNQSELSAAQDQHEAGEGWNDRSGSGRSWDQKEYRWDGHHLYRLVDGQWVDVTPYRHGVVDRWYVDQVIAAQL